MPEAPGSLGEAVRSARESAQLSVPQVSALTCIRIPILLDLEQGRTAGCGGRVFARGHLRAIAAATGSDPAVLLDAYDQGRSAPTRSLAAPLVDAPGRGAVEERTRKHDRSRTSPREGHAGARRTLPGSGQLVRGTRAPTAPAEPPERRPPRWGLAAALAAAVLAVLVLVDLRPAPQAESLPAVSAPAPAAKRVAPQVKPPRAPRAAVRAAVPTKAALRLRVLTGSSWVAVSAADGGTLFSGVLAKGRARVFSDPAALRVTVGNAAAVSLVCGDRGAAAPAEVPVGKAGQVRRYTCAPRGLSPA